MKCRHEKLVLVLFSLAASTILWISGCAGVTEPLPTLAVAPDKLTVSAKVGTSSALPVTLTNTGTTPVSVSQAVLTGTGFSMTGLTMPVSLAAGKSTSFSVKFLASKTGNVDGSVSFMTDAAHRAVMLPLHGAASSTTPDVSSITISPAVASPAPSAKVQFTAAIQGSTTNESVTWAATIGSITTAGVFTAPATGGSGKITATSVADPTKSATATVTVAAASNQPSGSGVTSVTVSPATASSVTSGTLSFTASVQGSASNKSVTWKALLGTITSTGAYKAPAKAGVDTVTATSVADPSKSDTSSVTVTTSAATPTVNSITVSPGSTSVATGGKFQFTAVVQGTVTDKSVTWKATLGTITSSGAYTAPAKAGTDTVTATSNAETSKSASASVAVTAAAPNPPNPPSTSSSESCSGSNCAAFPGAEGGGAAAVGGRGGVVIEVTNLNDSGNGSLRACVEASGPRTCVFRVGGNIVNHSRLQVSNPYLTIAGQTAPGGGITIGGASMQGEALFINTHDVIVRYITCNGFNPNTPTGPDTGTVCFEATSGAHDVIWDHVSLRWWGNKGFISYSNDTSNVNNVIHNLSLQWALVYEPNLTHPVGPGTDAAAFPAEAVNQDFHHMLFANVGHRIPEVATPQIRFVSNVVYNFNYFASEPDGGVSMDFIDNKYVAGNMNVGNSNPHPVNVNSSLGTNCLAHCDLNGVAPSIHMSGNVGPQGTDYELSCETTSEGGGEGACPIRGSWQRSSPLPKETFPITADAASSLDSVLLPTVGNSQMLDCDGGWTSRRDSQDARIINQYKTLGSGGLFTGQFTQSALASGSSTSCIESLHDGLPDQWKTAKGLSTSDPNLYKAKAPNGYTWLENYLNGQ